MGSGGAENAPCLAVVLKKGGISVSHKGLVFVLAMDASTPGETPFSK